MLHGAPREPHLFPATVAPQPFSRTSAIDDAPCPSPLHRSLTVHTLQVPSSRRNELVEITGRVQALVTRGGIREGMVALQSLHTTAALTVNENADPDVPHDLLAKLEHLVPQHEGYYRHAEGNSDSHLKTSFFGPSLTVLVSDGRLVLGRWQGIWLAEFDGPRERRVAVQLFAAVGEGAP